MNDLQTAVEALEPYLDHLDDCKGWMSPARAHNGGLVYEPNCSCGLNEKLAALRQVAPQTEVYYRDGEVIESPTLADKIAVMNVQRYAPQTVSREAIEQAISLWDSSELFLDLTNRGLLAGYLANALQLPAPQTTDLEDEIRRLNGLLIEWKAVAADLNDQRNRLIEAAPQTTVPNISDLAEAFHGEINDEEFSRLGWVRISDGIKAIHAMLTARLGKGAYRE